MASRPAKTGGNTTYTAEVAAGQTTIKASEVDGDLNEIYTNITNANVAAGAAITYAKLSLTNGLVNADVNSAAAIVGTKLAVGAAVNTFASFTNSAGIGSFTTVETTLGSFAITTRGGRVLLLGALPISITISTTLSNAKLRWYRGVTMISEIGYDVQANAGTPVIPLPTPNFSDAPAAGTYTYALKGLGSATVGMAVATTGGTIMGVELS